MPIIPENLPGRWSAEHLLAADGLTENSAEAQKPSRLWKKQKQKHKSSCFSPTPLQHKFQDQTKTHRFLLGDCRLPSGHYQPWGCLSLDEIKISERCRDTFEQEARQPGNLICYKSIIAFQKAQRVLPHICITTDLKLLQFTAVRHHSKQQNRSAEGRNGAGNDKCLHQEE